MYKVLLAENEQIFVNGLEEVFANLPNSSICSMIQNVDNLVEICQRVKPDLVITRTFYFLQKTAFEAVKELKAAFPNIKVIMMLDTGKYAQMEMALAAGADACVERAGSPLDYISVISKTMAGETVPMAIPDGNAWGPDKVRFTKRDLEVVLCLCQNLPNDKIAERLGLREEQIDAAIKRILIKTKHKNVLGLVFEAIHKGYDYNWRAENE